MPFFNSIWIFHSIFGVEISYLAFEGTVWGFVCCIFGLVIIIVAIIIVAIIIVVVIHFLFAFARACSCLIQLLTDDALTVRYGR